MLPVSYEWYGQCGDWSIDETNTAIITLIFMAGLLKSISQLDQFGFFLYVDVVGKLHTKDKMSNMPIIILAYMSRLICSQHGN